MIRADMTYATKTHILKAMTPGTLDSCPLSVALFCAAPASAASAPARYGDSALATSLRGGIA